MFFVAKNDEVRAGCPKYTTLFYLNPKMGGGERGMIRPPNRFVRAKTFDPLRLDTLSKVRTFTRQVKMLTFARDK